MDGTNNIAGDNVSVKQQQDFYNADINAVDHFDFGIQDSFLDTRGKRSNTVPINVHSSTRPLGPYWPSVNPTNSVDDGHSNILNTRVWSHATYVGPNVFQELEPIKTIMARYLQFGSLSPAFAFRKIGKNQPVKKEPKQYLNYL